MREGFVNADVVITSWDIAMTEISYLRKAKWDCVVSFEEIKHIKRN